MAKKKHSNLAVKRFVSTRGENQYLLLSAGEAAVIDVSDAAEEIGEILNNIGIELKFLFITHAHRCLSQTLHRLRNKHGGDFCLHEYEYELLQESDAGLEPNRFVKDGETLQLGDVNIEVLLTAGHTKGSVCYYIKKAHALFSGNTLLKGGYGKIWGPKSMSLMLFSLKRLSYNIPAETTVYTGTGDSTSMGGEGWIQCLRSA